MKETHYKLKHRVTALFAAAVMLCSMLPGAAFAEEPTPQPTEETVQMEQQTEPSETDNGQTDESSPDPGEDVTEATPETAEEQPAEEEISAAVVGAELYTDLPNAPIGSYIGSEGLPVATGETKIGISEWPESQLEETSGSYLTAAALDNDGLTMVAPLLDGADYAIVPIMAQVEYPADGSSTDMILPDGVTLLDDAGLLRFAQPTVRRVAQLIARAQPLAAVCAEPDWLAHLPAVLGALAQMADEGWICSAQQLPGGWLWRYSGVGLAHQSNGQSDPLSRSWNRAYVMAGFEKDNRFNVQMRLWKRLSESAEKDNNPDLTRYLGRGDVTVGWNIDSKNSLRATYTGFNKRGSGRIEWTRSLGDGLGNSFSGLRLYTALFHGYGDSLLDYNFKRTVFSIGLSLVDF